MPLCKNSFGNRAKRSNLGTESNSVFSHGLGPRADGQLVKARIEADITSLLSGLELKITQNPKQ